MISPMVLVIFNVSFTMKILYIIFSVVHTKFYPLSLLPLWVFFCVFIQLSQILLF